MPARPSHRHGHLRSRRRAFTLLEMMLVIMIIGLLMGVAVWNIVGQSGKARRSTTVASMRQIDSMLKAYVLDYGAYPPTLDSLVPKYTEKLPVDAWKRPFNYTPTPSGQHKFELYSNGESDSTGNSNDIIDFWKVDEQGNPTQTQ
jgi:general secretion pathway protein G